MSQMLIDFVVAYPDVVGLTLIILSAVSLILLIITIVNTVGISKLKKSYKKFMNGEDGKSLEAIIKEHIDEIDKLISDSKKHSDSIDAINNTLKITFQKYGLVKYDAFQEMGGKISFSLCLLNESNDGFIINAMHSREGCYTYIKEVIAGNPVIMLSDEEKQALAMAKEYKA